MRLAQISDLHILSLRGVAPARFLNRRILGGANLLLRRSREYLPQILEFLIEDLLREQVDHVAVTGDLSNLALEPEFERVFHLLKLLGGYERVSVVPGNHDYYTVRAAETRRFEKYFYPFMFRREFSDMDVDLYPYTKRLDGGLLLIGLNSATRTLPGFAYGTLGDRQLARLERILESPERAGQVTCIILHHAMHKKDLYSETNARLLNRERLLELVEKYSVELVLYGHDHVGRTWRKDSGSRSTLMVCCGSSTRLVSDPNEVARYRIINIENGRLRRLETKVYDPSTRRFVRK